MHISQCVSQHLPRTLALFSSVTSLDLSNSSISDSDLECVLTSLPPHLIAIDLSHNPLSSHVLPTLLSSTTMLQSVTFIGCRFLPSCSNGIADSIRIHPSLTSVAFQVDGSASAFRLLHAACNRPETASVHICAPYTAASQHVLSFTFPPLLHIASIAIINVPIHISWAQSLLSSISRADSSATNANVAVSSPQSSSSLAALQPSSSGLRRLRLVNNGRRRSRQLSSAFLLERIRCVMSVVFFVQFSTDASTDLAPPLRAVCRSNT